MEAGEERSMASWSEARSFLMCESCRLALLTREFIRLTWPRLPLFAMLIIGLTGSIASGKSTACAYLRKLDPQLPILDADKLSYEATQKGHLPYILLRYLILPRDCFDPQTGALIRPKLAAMIFAATPKATHLRKIVERCIHPYVIFRMLMAMLWYWLCGYSRIVLDIPLLFEVNLTWMCSTTVLIDIPDKQVQLDRLLRRNPDMSETEAKNRVAAQFSLERKRKLADHIVMNDKDLRDFEGKLKSLFNSQVMRPKHNSLWILPCLLVILAMFWICWYRTPAAQYS